MNVQERVIEMTARVRDEATAYLDLARERVGDLRQPLGVLAQAGNQFNALSSQYFSEVAKLALATYADLRQASPARGHAGRKTASRGTTVRRARASSAPRRARAATATA